MMRFLISFACHQAILANGRQRKVLMSVCSSFGAQLVGVLGADAFATWQETSTWNTPGSSFGLVCISVVIFALLLAGTAWLRGKAGMEAEHQEFCSKCDVTVAATSISLVLIQFWRFFLAGRLPHFLGIQRSMYGRSETSCLFLTLLVLLATFLILEFHMARPSVAQGPRGLVQSLRVGVKTLAYGSAWCAFFWVQWFDHQVLMSGGDLASAGEVIKAEMYCAMAFSAFCMTVAIAGELSREKWPQVLTLEACFGQLSEASCFAMCLTWNSAFQTACAFSKDMQASNFNQVFARCTQCQWMCILLIPSWLFFILPRVIAGEKSVGDQTADGDSQKEGDDKGTSNSEEKDKAPAKAEADTPKPVEGVQSSEAEPKSAPPTDPAPPEEEF